MSLMSVTKTFRNRFMLVIFCLCGAMFLVTYGGNHGFLGPQEVGNLRTILPIVALVALLLIFRRYVKDYRAAAPPPGTPIDEATRKRRLRYIRDAKIGIVILAATLVFVLSQSQFREFPVAAVLSGALMDLSAMAGLIILVVRLKKSLK